jgi:hypothetical protein
MGYGGGLVSCMTLVVVLSIREGLSLTTKEKRCGKGIGIENGSRKRRAICWIDFKLQVLEREFR